MAARRKFQFSNLTIFWGRYFRIPRRVLFADFPVFMDRVMLAFGFFDVPFSEPPVVELSFF